MRRLLHERAVRAVLAALWLGGFGLSSVGVGCCVQQTRNSYFDGKLLTAQDFESEQEYFQP